MMKTTRNEKISLGIIVTVLVLFPTFVVRFVGFIIGLFRHNWGNLLCLAALWLIAMVLVSYPHILLAFGMKDDSRVYKFFINKHNNQRPVLAQHEQKLLTVD